MTRFYLQVVLIARENGILLELRIATRISQHGVTAKESSSESLTLN